MLLVQLSSYFNCGLCVGACQTFYLLRQNKLTDSDWILQNMLAGEWGERGEEGNGGAMRMVRVAGRLVYLQPQKFT